MKETYFCWALSRKFDWGRSFLGKYCWQPSQKTGGIQIASFKTRKLARKAQKTCCYKQTRVERIKITLKRM